MHCTVHYGTHVVCMCNMPLLGYTSRCCIYAEKHQGQKYKRYIPIIGNAIYTGEHLNWIFEEGEPGPAPLHTQSRHTTFIQLWIFFFNDMSKIHSVGSCIVGDNLITIES